MSKTHKKIMESQPAFLVKHDSHKVHIEAIDYPTLCLYKLAPELLRAVKRYERSSANQHGENNQIAVNLRILIAMTEGR